MPSRPAGAPQTRRGGGRAFSPLTSGGLGGFPPGRPSTAHEEAVWRPTGAPPRPSPYAFGETEATTGLRSRHLRWGLAHRSSPGRAVCGAGTEPRAAGTASLASTHPWTAPSPGPDSLAAPQGCPRETGGHALATNGSAPDPGRWCGGLGGAAPQRGRGGRAPKNSSPLPTGAQRYGRGLGAPSPHGDSEAPGRPARGGGSPAPTAPR